METKVGKDRIVPQKMGCQHVDRLYAATRHNPVDVQFERTVGYINGLRTEVIATDRNNFAISVEPTSGPLKSRNLFLVIHTYRFMRSILIDPHQALTDEAVAKNRELKIIRDYLDECITTGIRQSSTLTIQYSYTAEDFKKSNGRFYCDQTGLVLSVAKDDLIDTHPQSEEGILLARPMPAGFEFSVMINDPNNVFGEHFVNVHNEVYRVPVRQAPTLKAGVYITGTLPVPHDDGNILSQRYYDFDAARQLKFLFVSAAEAKTMGDPENVYKQTIDRIKAEQEIEKARQAEELSKAEQERRIQETDFKRREIQLKQEMTEMENRFKLAELDSKRQSMILDNQYALEKHVRSSENDVRNKILNEDKYRYDQAKTHNATWLEVAKVVGVVGGALSGIALLLSKK